jgi:hypothetical protein
MSALLENPTNKNFLSPLGFKFLIKRAPNVNFFIQRVNIPNISLQETYHNNPFVKIPYAGDHMEYGSLRITFKVDEDLNNYLEIHNWIRGLGFPKNFEEYKNINDQNVMEGKGLRSDISLIILNSTMNPNYEIIFIDAFPISLSELTFNTTDPTVNYLEASAEFKYTLFNISSV